MIALILCGAAFIVAYLMGRRSPVAGLMAVLGVGYFFGIIRANVPSSFSYFVFDAAVIGYYLTLPWSQVGGYVAKQSTRQLSIWVAVLIGWPLFLLLLPIQDPLVQLVGLRAHVLLLPFLLIGARLSREEIDRLAYCVAVLNCVALTFAIGELLLGVPYFYPRNPVTELIYRSTDVSSAGILGAFRIPAIFANASSYGATMTITLPLVVGAWMQKSHVHRRRWLLSAGMVAAVLGVFLAASRTHMMILIVLMMVTLFSGRIGPAARAVWILMLTALAWVVIANERLIVRLLSLSPEAIVNRLSVSVNRSFLENMFDYPLGNGLGGGGSSMPYFLQHLIRNPIWIENQYATFMMELGIPGMLLWIAFIVWVLTRRTTLTTDRWWLGRRLMWLTCAAYYVNGLIGIGFLTSVPFTVLLLLGSGWLTTPQGRPVPMEPYSTRPAPTESTIGQEAARV